MKNTTLIYLKKDHKYLMMHRNRKKDDLNEGKWIGIGGKIEENETPEEGAFREIEEETGIVPRSIQFRGIVIFINTLYETEYMFLYTSDDFECGDYLSDSETSGSPVLPECNEGELHWVDIDSIGSLNLWEGDRYFLELLKNDAPPFIMTLRYDGDTLTGHECRSL